VTSRIEHRAVLDTARRLQERGVGVSLVPGDRNGYVAVDRVEAALRPETRLVSIMLANNETGVLQDLPAIVALCRERGVLVHTDAAQVVGHLPVSVRHLDVDLLSLSAHKMGGPSGVGALWVGERARALRPVLGGGGQEMGLRPGTLPVHQLVGMGEACERVSADLVVEAERQRALGEHLFGLLAPLGGVVRNGSAERAVPHILNLHFEGVDGEALHASLEGLAVSGGSACGAERGEPSYVLRALGLTDAQAEASIRFSFGRQTSGKEIEKAAKIVENALIRLRGMAPQ
jgi:cysteine desulfurase